MSPPDRDTCLQRMMAMHQKMLRIHFAVILLVAFGASRSYDASAGRSGDWRWPPARNGSRPESTGAETG